MTESHSFEDVFDDDPVAHVIYQTLTRIRRPMQAEMIAEHGSRDVAETRRYLEQFREYGFVTLMSDGTYSLNDHYLRQQHIQDLASRHTPAELTRYIETLTEQIETYEQRHRGPRPADADPDMSGNRTSEELRNELLDWQSARGDRIDYQEALRSHRERSKDKQREESDSSHD